jgi:hypothetical protein
VVVGHPRRRLLDEVALVLGRQRQSFVALFHGARLRKRRAASIGA